MSHLLRDLVLALGWDFKLHISSTVVYTACGLSHFVPAVTLHNRLLRLVMIT